MRLIDADKLIEEMRKWYWDDEKQKAVEENESPMDLFTNLAILTVKEQPTAYDVDKVVQQLDDRSTLSRPVGWTKFYQIMLLKDAIKIVKDGEGRSENRKEWLNSEYVEPEVDWSKVPIDTPILVRVSEDEEWDKRYFAGFNEKKFVHGRMVRHPGAQMVRMIITNGNMQRLQKMKNNQEITDGTISKIKNQKTNKRYLPGMVLEFTRIDGRMMLIILKAQTQKRYGGEQCQSHRRCSMKNDINVDSFIVGFVFGIIIGILGYSCF